MTKYNKPKMGIDGEDLYLDEGDIVQSEFDEVSSRLPSSLFGGFEGFDPISGVIEIPTEEHEFIDSRGKTLLRELFYNSHVDIGSDEGMILDEVITIFGNILDDLDLTEGLFFESEEAVNIFAKAFDVYNFQLNVEIAKIEGEIGFFNKCSRFYDGWQDRVRKAAYFAFFVHFGAKRKFEYYEIEGEKIKKDYISHVFGASFESLIDKIHFLDEEILLATLLHDTHEDFAKGFLGLLNMSEENGASPGDLQEALYEG
ncbi:hypothetical protein GF354_03125, partial [Candidatus Peregrinibacteria bacterium]|nr:hypothetical protein [Candidatus Peregrinibacteria bacterium]